MGLPVGRLSGCTRWGRGSRRLAFCLGGPHLVRARSLCHACDAGRCPGLGLTGAWSCYFGGALNDFGHSG